MNINRLFKYSLSALAILAFCQFADAEIRHTVKKGETIFGIAHKYDVSPESILEINPQAANGLKKNMILVIPETNDPKSNVSQPEPTVNEENNSAAIKSEAPAAQPVVKDKPEKEDKGKKQKKKENVVVETPQESEQNTEVTQTVISCLSLPGDTFKSISERTGVSEDVLIELNPFVDPIRIPAGTQIRLSESAPYNIYADIRNGDIVLNPSDSEPTDITEEDVIVEGDVVEGDVVEDTRRNLMILLPFMAGTGEQTKSSKQYADFYRGFLLAANQYNNSGPLDVEVVTLDTQGDLSKIKTQLSNTTDRDIAVIIAPEEESQLQTIIDEATNQGVYVLNIFNFKNEEFKTNPYILQGNINQKLMYDKAIEALTTQFEDYTPVILSPTDAKEEKAPFIAAVRKHYEDAGIEPIEIVFDDALTEKDLDVLDPETKYVFLYKSGSQSVFNRAALTLLNIISEDGYNGRYGVFGYPDWTMFRNASLSHLHQLGAVIYSRFDFGGDSAEMKELQDKFMRWYGVPMMESFPSQGALGYDVGTYLLGSLQQRSMTEQLQSGEVFQGVQSTFNFTHDEGAEGYINDALYIITYRPDGSYSVKVL